MSVSHVMSPAERKRRQARGTRRPAVLSRTARAAIEPSTSMTPSTIAASFSVVGVVMKRVSTSMRADRPWPDVAAGAAPGCAATLRSVKIPATCGFFSGARVPADPGMPTKSAPTCPTLAHTCRTLQLPAATAGRGAAAATESRNATNTVSVLARTNSAPLVDSVACRGTVDSTTPPSAGSVATARQGMEMSRAWGAPDTSGAVMSETRPSVPADCGQLMVAVVCLTGNNGTSAHSTTPAIPATTATARAMAESRVRSGSSRGTRVDVRRRA
jgi:hypothetical protein